MRIGKLDIEYRVNPLGLLAGIAIAIEGLITIAYAAPIEIKGIGGIMQQTVMLGGAQLFVLGLLLAIAWLLKDYGLAVRERKILSKRWIQIIAILLGAIVAAEGIVLALSAGPTVIGGIGGVMEQTVVLAGAQLFGLGALASVTWILRRDPSMRAKIGRLLAVVIGICISAEGLIVMGMSGPSIVNGIGGIMGQTVLIAGVQLFVLGLLVVSAWTLKDLGLLKRKVLYWDSLPDLLIFFLGIIIAFEGLSTINLAAGTYVESIGWMLGQTIMLAGVQLFALGFLQIVMMGFPSFKRQGALTKMAILGMLFLILMVPAAFVF